jgi:hypothetical protein
MGHGIATAAAHVELQSLAALDQHAQNLLDAVTLHGELAGDGGGQRSFMGAQEGRRLYRTFSQAFGTEDPAQQLVGEAESDLAVVG